MSKTITLNHITKIEGHAKLDLKIQKGAVVRCELSATEGARYFEGIVKGRKYYEAHEMTSRICGICSCAHVVAALSAIENAVGVTPSQQTKQLRVLLTLAERIRSHATHLYFLALPDYLGYESALAMASKYKKELKRALHLMKVGNSIITLLGARELHPVSATVGGWLKLPTNSEIKKIKQDLESVKEDAQQTCELFFSLDYPDFTSGGELFSLIDPKQYAVLDGTFSSASISFTKKDYRKHVDEHSESHSTANFVKINNKPYQVGGLSRLANNGTQLRPSAQQQYKKSGIEKNPKNPYFNNMAQAIELVHCIDHALAVCNELTLNKERQKMFSPLPGTGVGALEVPRGTLWHEYTTNTKGSITGANIITPTAQNLLNIQEDIRQFLPSILHKKKKDLIMDVEKLIRSYDPCFSCSAHFLEVNWV